MPHQRTKLMKRKSPDKVKVIRGINRFRIPRRRKSDAEKFYTFMRDCIYQLDDDGLRAQFDAALGRFRHVHK